MHRYLAHFQELHSMRRKRRTPVWEIWQKKWDSACFCQQNFNKFVNWQKQ